MLHIPYIGSTLGTADVIAGNVMLIFPNIPRRAATSGDRPLALAVCYVTLLLEKVFFSIKLMAIF